MIVILRFRNIADMKAEGKTFYVKLNDVNELALQNAREEYMAEPDVFELKDVEAYVNTVRWQEHRIERLGRAQASMMSARTRIPYLFSGYELPERLVPKLGTDTEMVPYWCLYPVWDWKSLVSDDYLKDINDPNWMLRDRNTENEK